MTQICSRGNRSVYINNDTEISITSRITPAVPVRNTADDAGLASPDTKGLYTLEVTSGVSVSWYCKRVFGLPVIIIKMVIILKIACGTFHHDGSDMVQ